MGQRSCSDGKWGACIGDRISTLRLPAGQQRTQALGTGKACPDNPCDPYCRIVIDSPQDLPLPDGGPFTSDGGLQVKPVDQGGLAACTSMAVKPTPQSVTITGFGANGLKAEYFNKIDSKAPQISAAWQPVVTRTDANIEFNWDVQPTPTGISSGQFSVRWTGSLVAPNSEAYTFCTETDDGSRLWIDGVLVVDSWYDHGAVEICGPPLSLVQGSAHSLRFEFYQHFANASAQLRWSTPTIADQVVPPSAFVIPGSIIPITSNKPKFGVELSPAGCFPGAPSPIWTLDRPELAAIDANGEVTLRSATAGPINVTAYLGRLSGSGVLNVTTDISDVSQAGTTNPTAFQAAAGGADDAAILYPYDQTVLPIGLAPPNVQWDSQLSSASAIKLLLRYPVSGTALFSWSEIIAESNPPQASIPAQIWSAFEQTAKGKPAQLSLQRIVSGQLRQPTTRTINFSSAPARGKIYYTQYHRGAETSEMVFDSASPAPAAPAFNSNDGCPVCHSVSASGNLFATASRSGLSNNDYANPITYSATLGGISSVNANGSLSPIADFVGNPPRPNYTGGSVDWRGFAWAPLTPDGKFALVANNVWGNTRENLVGIDASTRQVNTGSSLQSGGSGTGLLALFYATADTTFSTPIWKTFIPQVNSDFGAASPGGLVPLDFAVKRTGQIQGYFSETYHFEVVTTSSDVFTLKVGASVVGPVSGPTSLTADVALSAGALLPLELTEQHLDGNSDVQLYWSSRSTPRALVPQSQLFPPAKEPAHGANVVYHDNASSADVERIEPDIASDFGEHSPSAGIAADDWTSTWNAQLESPYSGPLELCVDADDGVELYLDQAATPLISSTVPYVGCAAAGTWTLGAMHTLRIVHTDTSAVARMILKYRYGGVTEVVPSANLYPLTPASAVSGLTATYYDTEDFNLTLGPAAASPHAFQRIDPNVDFDWALGRPNYSALTDDDRFSARWTGHIVMPCDGVYEFRSDGFVDDGGRLWIDDARVMARWDYGALSGARYFQAGAHDFKFDWYENTGDARVRLQWKTPCAGSPGWVTIPSGSFTPNAAYARSSGFVVDGGDNGNNSDYWVWQLPSSAAPIPVDATPASPGNWGLSGSSMMVPSFSPDGSKLVFIDGDSAGGAGWRKGLSTFDFDEAGKVFKNRRLIASTWPLGDVMKWPTFESDSRSVIFQTTAPGDACCRNSMWPKYGYMGPSNYSEDPGRLWSVDTQAPTPSPVPLAKLNSGERASDANKSYQPTMLPAPAGGYRWVVFTSTRPYGNTLNLPGSQQDFSNPSNYTANTNALGLQSQLWVAAIDDAPSGSADRSHPAFWLPGQNFAADADAATGYVNLRADWVLDACHPTGGDQAASCQSDDDCCGGVGATKTTSCQLDTPLQTPPTRHCQALPKAGACVASGQSCSDTAACCGGSVCANATCTPLPIVSLVGPQNYERIYQADCAEGTKVVWRFFDWQTVTPATNSQLQIFAESQADPKQFSTLPTAPNPVMNDQVVMLHIVSGAPVTTWTGQEVDLLLQKQMLKSQKYLKITVRFVPNDELTASPVLKNWRQSYSCVPAE